MRDKLLPRCGVAHVKSFVLALALTGVSWNFGSQADAQPDRGSFYQEAGVVAHQALQSSDDPVRVPLLELVAWGINSLHQRDPQTAEESDGVLASTDYEGT